MKVRLAAKRSMDLVIAGALLIVLGPLMAAIAVAVVVADGRPVFFRQQRPGLDGKPFLCRKYRTMRAPKPGQNSWTTDSHRTTALGRVLRRTSLDELPELINVIAGEMSLVGPRPLLMDYLPLYSAKHRRRHDMRPGITGLAQVSGRRMLTFAKRLDLDAQYVEKWTIRGDCVILARTLLEPFRNGDVAGQILPDAEELPFHETAANVRNDPASTA